VDNPFLQSIVAQPPIILGRQLRPLSAYHLAALMLLDSPFSPVEGNARLVKPEDLATAVFVCSYGFADGPGVMFPELDITAFTAMQMPTPETFGDDLDDFEMYLDCFLVTPNVWMPTSEAGKASPRQSGVPVPFLVVAYVLQHFGGLTRTEAWDMPFSELVAYKCAIQERYGFEVENDTERAAVEKLKAAKAQAEAEAEMAATAPESDGAI